MNKQEFLSCLQKGLSGLRESDIEERITFYGEMVDDRMEDGFSEEDAVRDIGDVEDIVSQIIAETPFIKIVKEKVKPKRRLRPWEIVLLAVGAPVWLSLLIASVAVIFSLYVVWWSVIISLWSVFASFVGVSIGGLALGILMIVRGNVFAGVAMIGAAIACVGLAIFSFLACKVVTKGILWLTKKFALRCKKHFLKKEEME